MCLTAKSVLGLWCSVWALWIPFCGTVQGQAGNSDSCFVANARFISEVWSKVGAVDCLKCHRQGGDAEDSRFVLHALGLESSKQQQSIHAKNLKAFQRMAAEKVNGQSLLLQKVVGGLSHGGEKVVEANSTSFKLLKTFVERRHDIETSQLSVPTPSVSPSSVSPSSVPQELVSEPFFTDVILLNPKRLLRKATLSLAGRLPSPAEQAAVVEGRLNSIEPILLQLMTEDAFYVRLRESFNDIFLTHGVDGNPDSTVLSYEHFEKTRLWYQDYDLSHIEDEKERRQAGYQIAGDYRAALLEEPMRLVEYIVRQNRPMTEIVTADYIMVSPYTSRGYGVFDEVKDQFKDPENPFEFIPLRLGALKGRGQKEDQDSESGFYPHAGVLSTFQYLSRYPTTETNRNRLRARMYYQHFLGVDVLELATRVSDAAAVSEKYETPTMEAPECVVCHTTLDPVAGLFQDYWRFDRNFAIYGKRHEGWFDDMFQAGFEGEELPEADRWRALQWLGERTAKDPRFAIVMAEHAYYLLTGRRPLLAPSDLDDPLFEAKFRAWKTLRCQTESVARGLVQGGFDFKRAIVTWVLSDFYRADAFSIADASPVRLAELDDVGVVRMLSPEQLERKISAVFGRSWGQLNGQTAMLYGGIDSKEVTERASDPGGAMGAIQRTLSNDVACRNVAYDFSRSRGDRILFPNLDPDVLPGVDQKSDALIRSTIAHLHWRILGRDDAVDSDAVAQTFDLFSAVIADASLVKNLDQREAWTCRQGLESPVPDPNYTVRSWRAVVTYLLRQEGFLYE